MTASRFREITVKRDCISADQHLIMFYRGPLSAENTFASLSRAELEKLSCEISDYLSALGPARNGDD